MKIETIKGDLFKTDIIPIMHGCNGQFVMGSGVAKIVRERFPQAYQSYIQWGKENPGIDMLGKVQAIKDGTHIILNAITQNLYGKSGERFCSYDAIAECCSSADSWAVRRGYPKIAMPMIGAGLGGGDWNVISAIIESEFVHTIPVVYVL